MYELKQTKTQSTAQIAETKQRKQEQQERTLEVQNLGNHLIHPKGVTW